MNIEFDSKFTDLVSIVDVRRGLKKEPFISPWDLLVASLLGSLLIIYVRVSWLFIASASWLFAAQSDGVRVAGFPCVPFREPFPGFVVYCVLWKSNW